MSVPDQTEYFFGAEAEDIFNLLQTEEFACVRNMISSDEFAFLDQYTLVTPTTSEPSESPGDSQNASAPSAPNVPKNVQQEERRHMVITPAHHGATAEPPNSAPSAPKSEKEERRRMVFTPAQVNKLEAKFRKKQFIDRIERYNLSLEIGAPEESVKLWFQNRRARNRNQCLLQQKATMQQPSPMVAELARSTRVLPPAPQPSVAAVMPVQPPAQRLLHSQPAWHTVRHINPNSNGYAVDEMHSNSVYPRAPMQYFNGYFTFVHHQDHQQQQPFPPRQPFLPEHPFPEEF